MLVNIFEEISWQDFIKKPEMQGKALNEQQAYYLQYLQELNQARQSYTDYQAKGAQAALQAAADVETPGDPATCADGMDVVFLIDYTGSMGGVINGVKTSVLSIVNAIIAQSGGDYRLGLALFDEYHFTASPDYATKPDYISLPASQRFVNTSFPGRKQYITAMEVLSDQNIDSFTTQLNKINTSSFPLGNGAGAPEPGGIGFEQILEGISGTFRSNVAKLVVLITDNVPGGDDDAYSTSVDDPYLTDLAATAYQQNVQALILTKYSGGETTGYRLLADGTNGTYTYSSTLSPADIITAIEDICVSNSGTDVTYTDNEYVGTEYVV